jgi:hypothetical protein
MDGMIVAVCDGGFIRAFSYDGKDLWTYRIRGKFAPFITRAPDGISWVAREESGGLTSLIALNRTGRKISELRFEKPFTAPPKAGLDGRLFVPFGGDVVTYTLHGQKLGVSPESADSYNGFVPLPPPVYPQVTLTMTRAEGRRPDGGLKWFVDITGAAVLPAYTGEGLLVVGGQNWLLAAYRVDDPSPAPPLETYKLDRRVDVPAWVSLEIIAEALRRGDVGANERIFASFLMDTCRVAPMPQPLPETVAERVEALALLGRLGSPEYIPFLTDVFVREPDTTIKAAAVRAIGAIGISRNTKTLDALVNAALPVFPLYDTVLVHEIIETAGKLVLINGPPAYRQGSAILGAFSSQQIFPGLQKRASSWFRRVFR